MPLGSPSPGSSAPAPAPVQRLSDAQVEQVLADAAARREAGSVRAFFEREGREEDADVAGLHPGQVIARVDGSKQLAYKGKPLYTWAKDQKPGDKTGDGVNNVWHAAKE